MGKYYDVREGAKLLDGEMFRSADDVERKVREIGFLPLFTCGVRGLSVEEHTPAELWFNDNVDGPWEWKGPIVRGGATAYAKYFRNKAVFVSLEWLPRLVNMRRGLSKPLGYDEERVLRAIESNENMLSTEIREECGFGRHGATMAERALMANTEGGTRASLDTILTRLQMKGRIVVCDFEYNIDKKGRPYGWGKARYTTPEILYADAFSLPEESPEESLEAVVEKVLATGLCPNKEAARRLVT